MLHPYDKEDDDLKNAQRSAYNNPGGNTFFTGRKNLGNKGSRLKANAAIPALWRRFWVLFATEWTDHRIPPL